ncbi:hypothetical protein [Streptomyces albidoflavus]|uniref:hypothetical protein n=1 Tax=Streptomyces albidoflavus TaxID=1886 RepID=UPI0033C73760
MGLHSRICYVATCDVCRTDYLDPETEAVVWFADVTTAEQIVRANGWVTLARDLPDRLICPQDDDAHRACIDALMPPEPVMQIPGQLGLDGTEESAR